MLEFDPTRREFLAKAVSAAEALVAAPILAGLPWPELASALADPDESSPDPEYEVTETGYKITQVEYQPALGRQGLPWISAQEIVDGTWDSTFDLFDEVDQIINGRYARSIYWKPTKVWMKDKWGGILSNSPHRPSAGGCQDATVSQWFTPVIEGDKEVIAGTGIVASEIQRKRIAALSFGGLYRYPEFERTQDAVEEVKGYVDNGYCVVVNRSPVKSQDWWGVVTGFDEQGRLRISRPTQGSEVGEQVEFRTADSLWNAAVIQGTEQAHPQRDGNFSIFNKIDSIGGSPTRRVAGLFMGTHQVVFL